MMMMMNSVSLREVHSLSQRQISTQCALVFPLSIYNILYFPFGHPVVAYAFFSSSRHFNPSLHLLSIIGPIQLDFLLFSAYRLLLPFYSLKFLNFFQLSKNFKMSFDYRVHFTIQLWFYIKVFFFIKFFISRVIEIKNLCKFWEMRSSGHLPILAA